MDYEKNKRYFELKEPCYELEKAKVRKGVKTIVFAVIGEILIAFICLQGYVDEFYNYVLTHSKSLGIFLFYFLWLLFVLWGILIIMISKYKQKKMKLTYEEQLVTDEEYDRISFSQIANIKEEALECLGIDEDQIKDTEPIIFSSYKLQDWTRAKKGKDGFWRTDSVECVFLCFSNQAVHCYTLKYNTLMQKKTVSTDVYFYGDIVSLSTVSDSITMKQGEDSEEVSYDSFKIITAGGTAFSVGIRDREKAVRSINAMRSFIHEKKSTNL